MKTKDFSGIKGSGLLPNPQEIKVPDDIGDLLDDYVESTSSLLEELEGATLSYESSRGCEESAAAIRRILHKIKGESGMVGIEDISEFCHQTEDAFEEIDEDQRTDMLLKFKDWTLHAMDHLAS